MPNDIVITGTTTSRQTVLRYTAPNTSPCTWEISESASYSPAIADVDSGLFSGGNSDDRTGSLGVGITAREFIVGTVPGPNALLSNTAGNGKKYGRALTPETTYYARVTCGSHTGTTSWTTKNRPAGITFAEPMPISAAGGYAYPTQDFTSRTETMIDPVFGTKLKKVTIPADTPDPDQAMGTAFDATGLGTGWTNPNNVLVNDGNSATYTGSTNQKLLLNFNTSFSDAYAPDSLRLYITGHSDVNTGNNNVVSACFTIDGSTCFDANDVRDFTLPLTTDDTRCQPNGGSETSCAGVPVPIDTWSALKLRRDQIVGSGNVGWLIWKKGTGTGTISIQFAKYDLRRSINADFTDTGSQWLCGQQTVNDSGGTPGYLCQARMRNGPTNLHWVNTVTGEVRFLGEIRFFLSGFSSGRPGSNSATFNGTDPTKMYFLVNESATGHAHVARCSLPAPGDAYYSGVAQNTAATCTWTDRGDLFTLITAFNGAYDGTVYNNLIIDSVQGDYMQMAARYGSQDSVAWMVSFKLSTDAIQGAFLLHGAANCHWCGHHTGHQALGTDKYSFTIKQLHQGGVGLGPYTTTLGGAGMDATSDPVTFTVAGEPTSAFAPTTLPNVATGDELSIGSERFTIVTRNSSTSWTVARFPSGVGAGAHATHNNGDTVTMECANHQDTDISVNAPVWWDVVNDPTGASLSIVKDLVNGHEGWAKPDSAATGMKIGEGGYFAGIVNPGSACSGPCFAISNSPTFGGVAKSASGNAWQQHAAPPQQTKAASSENFIAVDLPYPDTDPEISPSLTTVTGSLWKAAMGGGYSLNRKVLPMLAIAGAHPLLDISSTATGNVIGGTSGDNYKYCVANAVNECRTGSAIGDIYINAPGLTGASNCPSGPILADNGSIVCFGHLPGSGGQTVLQIGIVGASSIGKYFRSLTHGMMALKVIDGLSNAHQVPDNKWIMYPLEGDNRRDIWMVKTPSWPGYDGIDRNDFRQKSITVASLGGATEALVEWGYDDNFYCTSRSEVCVSAASNSPYFFASESFTAVSCAGGCTIQIPMIPDRVCKYRIKWRDSGHSVVQTSQVFSLADGDNFGGGNTSPSVRFIAVTC